MPFSRSHNRTVTDGSTTLSGNPLVVAFAEKVDIDVVLSTTTANQQLDLVLDVSEIKSLFMKASVNMTLKFNNSTTGTPTITLIAGQVVEWCYLDSNACPLAVDVTTVYVTPSAINGTLQLYFGVNPTN